MTASDLLDALAPGLTYDPAEAVRAAVICGHLAGADCDPDAPETDEPEDAPEPDDDEDAAPAPDPDATERRIAGMLAHLAARGLVTEPEPGRYRRAEDVIAARTHHGRVIVDGPLPARRKPQRAPGPPVARPPTGAVTALDYLLEHSRAARGPDGRPYLAGYVDRATGRPVEVE